METFMSRGPGSIERGISAAFAAEPNNAFTTDDLCRRAFPRVKRADKKHRVAVLRAAQKRPELRWLRSDHLGGQCVFFDPYSLMSYAMAQLKGGRGLGFASYNNNDDRILDHRRVSEADLRASLLPGGVNHKMIVPGGPWSDHVAMWIARRDGDKETVDRLEAKRRDALVQVGIPYHPVIASRQDAEIHVRAKGPCA
jgi:hypothetical protein